MWLILKWCMENNHAVLRDHASLLLGNLALIIKVMKCKSKVEYMNIPTLFSNTVHVAGHHSTFVHLWCVLNDGPGNLTWPDDDSCHQTSSLQCFAVLWKSVMAVLPQAGWTALQLDVAPASRETVQWGQRGLKDSSRRQVCLVPAGVCNLWPATSFLGLDKEMDLVRVWSSCQTHCQSFVGFIDQEILPILYGLLG